MKKKIILITGLVLLGVIPLAWNSLQAQTNTATPGKALHAHERHPAIRRAMMALREAKVEMEHADHDFGGHRKEALEQCDKALAQLKLALEFDKK